MRSSLLLHDSLFTKSQQFRRLLLDRSGYINTMSVTIYYVNTMLVSLYYNILILC